MKSPRVFHLVPDTIKYALASLPRVTFFFLNVDGNALSAPEVLRAQRLSVDAVLVSVKAETDWALSQEKPFHTVGCGVGFTL